MGCDVSLRSLWSMVDDGETGVLEVALAFPFEGDEDACRTLDEGIADQGTNGLGFADCEVLPTADLSFVAADG